MINYSWLIQYTLLLILNPALPAVCHLEDISAFVNKYGDDKGSHRSTHSNEVAAFKNTLRRAYIPCTAHGGPTYYSLWDRGCSTDRSSKAWEVLLRTNLILYNTLLSLFSHHRWRQCHNKRRKRYQIVDICRVGLSLRTIPPLSSLPTAGPSSNLSSLLTVVKISTRIFFNHRDFQFENDVNSETPSVSSLYYGRRTDTSTSVPTTPTPR